MPELHPTHVKEEQPVRASRPPQWYATYRVNCKAEILEESGDVTEEGERECPKAGA